MGRGEGRHPSQAQGARSAWDGSARAWERGLSVHEFVQPSAEAGLLITIASLAQSARRTKDHDRSGAPGRKADRMRAQQHH